VAARFVNMQDNGKAYRRALHDFDQYCIPNRLVLVWSSQVDAALHAFIYPMRRSRAELVHAAVLKAFPGLRGLLPCSVTAVREKAEAQPVTHHPPLPWGAVVLLAEGLRSRGLVRSGAGLLLMWRLGLRPGEFTQLGVEDLCTTTLGVSLVRLGRLRGTKTRRTAAVRVPLGDWRTRTRMVFFLASTPPGCRLTEWKRVAQVTSAIRIACEI
jgi:integrase